MWSEWFRVSKGNLGIAVATGALYFWMYNIPSFFWAGVGLISFLNARRAAKNGVSVLRSWRWKSRRGDDASVDELGGQGHHAFVQIVQDHAITGEDRGVLWFEDGHLKFAGAKTSFVITRGDLISRNWLRDNAGSVRGLMHELGLWLLSPVTGKKVYLAIGLVDPTGKMTEAVSLRGELMEFVVNSKPGKGQFPPLQIGPGAVSPLSVLVKFIGQFSASVFQGLVFVMLGRFWFDAAVCFGVGALSDMGALGYSRAFFSTWRRWRKKDKG